MPFRFTLIPRDEKFYELFEAQASLMVKIAGLLLDLVENFESVQEKAARIKMVEHDADVVCHQLYEKLNRSFITPFERADIHALTGCLDDVIDCIEGISSRLVLFGVKKLTPEAVELTRIIGKAVDEVEKAVRHLRQFDQLHIFLVEINRLENMADAITREMIGKLFRDETDTRELIKWKELYGRFENCADRCEDVADVIEDIVIKHT